MKPKHSRNTIAITIWNNVTAAVTRPYTGSLSHYTISAVLLLWIFLAYDYTTVDMPWLKPILALVAAVIVRFQKWDLLPLLTALVVFGNYYAYVDKIDHYIMFDLLPLLIWSIIRYQESWYLYALLGFYFSTSGFAKLYHGWLALGTQRVENTVLYFNSALGIEGPIAVYALTTFPVWFWELLDWVTVLFELSWGLLIFDKRLAKVLLPLVVFFHFSTWLLLKIHFVLLLPVYLILVAMVYGNQGSLSTTHSEKVN